MTESIETSEADALPWRPSSGVMPAINTIFRKKPVEVEAFQLPAAGQDVPDAFHEWCERVGFSNFESGRDETLLITTPEGVMEAQPADWIVCGVMGEFYPCKPEVFAATHVPAAMTSGQAEVPAGWLDLQEDPRVNEIVSGLYRRFKDWSRRGFSAEDVTWCEVKADVVRLIGAVPPAAAPAPEGGVP